MEAHRARLIAERVHLADRDAGGAAVLAHVERVVRATPADAHAVAWLHEVVERGAVTEHELLAEDLSDDQLRALRLVTAPTWTHSYRVYLVHVELIARAAGWPGQAARAVKVADLNDGRAHPFAKSADAWTPPYVQALRRLCGTGTETPISLAVPALATASAPAGPDKAGAPMRVVAGMAPAAARTRPG
jgi:hypothetical protein